MRTSIEVPVYKTVRVGDRVWFGDHRWTITEIRDGPNAPIVAVNDDNGEQGTFFAPMVGWLVPLSIRDALC